jgi:hypothetical protein
MIDWLQQNLNLLNLGWRGVAIGVVIFLITFSGSLALVSFLLVKLPPTYFQKEHSRDFWVDRHPAMRWSGIIVKNVVGAVFVMLGVVMSLPGVPGQGILTILLGVMLLDFPGKRHLEYKLVSQPRVFRAVNHLRAKFDKPPLLLD